MLLSATDNGLMVAAVFPSFPLPDVRPSVRYPCSDKFPECGGKRRIATFMYGVTYLVTLCKFGGFYIFRFPIDRFYSPIFIVSSLAPSVKRMVGGAFQLFIHALRSQIDDFVRRMAHCAFHGMITSVCSQYFIPNPDFIYRQEAPFCQHRRAGHKTRKPCRDDINSSPPF